MKFDKKMIDKILLLDDESLWGVIKMVAAKTGNESLKSLERPSNMEKFRQTLAGLNEVDLDRATEILNRGDTCGK